MSLTSRCEVLTLPLQLLRLGKPHHSLCAQTPNSFFALNVRAAEAASARKSEENLRCDVCSREMVHAHSLPVSQPSILSHVYFHFLLLYYVFFLCQRPPTRRKETSCNRATLSTRASSMSRQSKRPTASSSVVAAKSERGRRCLHYSPQQALKLSFQNPFSTALLLGREQNLIMARTKVTLRPSSI